MNNQWFSIMAPQPFGTMEPAGRTFLLPPSHASNQLAHEVEEPTQSLSPFSSELWAHSISSILRSDSQSFLSFFLSFLPHLVIHMRSLYRQFQNNCHGKRKSNVVILRIPLIYGKDAQNFVFQVAESNQNFLLCEWNMALDLLNNKDARVLPHHLGNQI